MKKLVLILFVCIAATAHAAQPPQVIDLEIGQALDLSKLGGPDVQIAITSADSSTVSFVTVDFDRMTVIVTGGNGGSRPTKLKHQAAITGESTLLFRRNGMTVFYVGSGERINHVVCNIVTEQDSKRDQ
ncbi:MAG: hypothetical protein WA183_11770 [Chthoniobacterales bacterium]